MATASPQLVPIAAHQYLAGPADVSGNPVLSIYGEDVIVMAPDLKSYLVQILKLEQPPDAGSAERPPDSSLHCWHEVIDGLPWPRLST